MKCQILFSGKNKKDISVYLKFLLNFFPGCKAVVISNFLLLQFCVILKYIFLCILYKYVIKDHKVD